MQEKEHVVSRISVLVAKTEEDVKAEGIAAAVALRPDMTLVGGRCVPLAEAELLLQSVASTTRCALVLVGRSIEAREPVQRWLAKRSDLVVMYVDVVDDLVRLGLLDPDLDSLLTALRDLVEGADRQRRERVVHI